MNVGISVSRVGGSAQIKAMKAREVAGGLRLALAAFRELEAFAQLGTDLDAATQSKLDRGYRMVELLKQPQYQPMDVIDQIMVIYAANTGGMDDVPINQVRRFETEFLAYMKDVKGAARGLLAEKKELTAEVKDALNAAIADFKKTFKKA